MRRRSSDSSTPGCRTSTEPITSPPTSEGTHVEFSFRPAADVARQQRLVTDAALVHLAEAHGEARIGRRRLEQGVQRRSLVDLRHRLEAVVAVVAVEDEDVAAVERALEVTLEQPVRLPFVAGDLHHLGELALRLVVAALGLDAPLVERPASDPVRRATAGRCGTRRRRRGEARDRPRPSRAEPTLRQRRATEPGIGRGRRRSSRSRCAERARGGGMPHDARRSWSHRRARRARRCR